MNYILTSRNVHKLLFRMFSVSSEDVRPLVCMRKMIPDLSPTMHKGQAGRIAVIGGCELYTGAPYFAAISAMKVGADLAHVICTKNAAPVIKSYSPELIVHPILDSDKLSEEIQALLLRVHTIVAGPGLGREPHNIEATKSILTEAKIRGLPIIMDADALLVVQQWPELLRGYENLVLTPNAREFANLYTSLLKEPLTPSSITVDHVVRISQALDKVTVLCKGQHDIITNGSDVLVCDTEGSWRRCGGQGDLLAGSMATLVHWATQYTPEQVQQPDQQNGDSLPSPTSPPSPSLPPASPLMCAVYTACTLTRECSRQAYRACGRSALTTDMITYIHEMFEVIFGK